MTKMSLTLAAALLLGAASTASAAYDPWIVTVDSFTYGEGQTALASANAPRVASPVVGQPNDPRENVAIW